MWRNFKLYVNNFKTEKSKYRYRFSIGIGFALKFNIGTGSNLVSVHL